MMVLLGQRDKRWANVKIGKSNSLVKDYGCALVGISMLSDWYGCYKDPGYLAQNLRFLGDLILWQSVAEKLCFKFVWRAYQYDEPKILNSLKEKKTSVLLQLQKRHWVVGIKKVGNYYYVADPWPPSRRLVHKSQVTGSAHFSS